MGIKIKFRLLISSLFVFTLFSCDDTDMLGFFTAYVDADARFEQSGHDSVIELYSSSDDYVIFSMGDSHVGGTKNLDMFFDAAKKENPIATMMVGDITTGHKEDYDTIVKHIPHEDSLRTFKLVGNHDLFFEGWETYHSYFGTSTYLFTVNTPSSKDLYICLDSGGGTLGSLQLEWLKKTLESQRELYRYCIIFTHVNLIRMRPTASTNPNAEEVQILLDLFVKHNIDMVVTGHDHVQNVDYFGNTTHIIMDALTDDYSNAGYLKINISEKSPAFEFIRF